MDTLPDRFSLLEIDGYETPEVAPPVNAPIVQPVQPAPIPVAAPIPQVVAPTIAPRAVTMQSQTNVSNLTAVSDESEANGAIVFWSLTGDMDLVTLAQQWEANGLPASWLPKAPTPSTALARAMKAQELPNTLVRSERIKGNTKWSFWHNPEGNSESRNLAFKLAFSAELKEDNELAVTSENPDHNGIMQEAYQNHLNKLNSTDISSWLVGLTRRLNSVCLRASGGFYFVPQNEMQVLDKIEKAIHASTGHKVYEIPALKGVKTVVAVLDAIRRVAIEEIAKIEGELNSDDSNAFNARGIVTRHETLDALKAQVMSYERLLNQPMGDLVSRIDALKVRVSNHTTRTMMLETD